MKIDVEKGRMLEASFLWVHFVLRSPDIMAALSKSPFHAIPSGNSHFTARIFGVSCDLEVLGEPEPKQIGNVDIVADVRLPLALGRTHTVVHYRYRGDAITSSLVDLRFTLETTGFIMGLYAHSLRNRIDSYLSQVLSDNEKAAVMAQNNDPVLQQLLSSEQNQRIKQFRAKYADSTILAHKEEDGSVVVKLDKRVWDSELLELIRLHQKVGGKEVELEKELTRIRETRDSALTLLIARRMLEVIVTSICVAILKRPRGNEPLATVIDKIAKAEGIPEYVATSMSNLNRLSTYGAHPKDFSPMQVREALLALCSIMEWFAEYSQALTGTLDMPAN